MRALKTVFAVAVLLFLIAATAHTQQKQISDSEYMAQAQQEYPEKPITLLIPYGPGSASDQSARALTEAMKKHLSQPIVVVNRTEVTGFD